jgi:N-acetylneuraminic acid mutarotase
MKNIYLFLICLVTLNTAFAQWATTTPMSTTRAGHICANLSNGNVLVAGGWDYTSNLSSAEIFDAQTNTWTSVTPMNETRYLATATTLDNGNILVVGGYNGNSNLSSCELYNATTNTWTLTGSLTVGRSSHTATKLQNGKVLIVGGYTGSLNTPVCELYDPANNTWTSAGNLTFGRSYHTATILNSGNVAIIGGYDPNSTFQLTSVEIYDTTTNAWSAGASMSQARDFHAASKLNDGKVLVSGGRVFTGGTPNYNGLISAELFDPTTNIWTAASDFTSTPICYGQQVTLNNGNVLSIAGVLSFNTGDGASTPSVTYLYYSTLDAWDTTTMALDSRFEFASILMNDGRVMVSGGADNSVELYGAAAQTILNSIPTSYSLIELYPNPSKEVLFVKLNSLLDHVQISVIDLAGNEFETIVSNTNSGQLKLETSQLANGIYTLKLRSDTELNVKKFTVMH